LWNVRSFSEGHCPEWHPGIFFPGICITNSCLQQNFGSLYALWNHLFLEGEKITGYKCQKCTLFTCQNAHFSKQRQGHYIYIRTRTQQAFYPMGILGPVLVYNGWNMKLTNYFHPVQNVTMHETSVTSFHFSTKTTLLFYFPLREQLINNAYTFQSTYCYLALYTKFTYYVGQFIQNLLAR
jgi:hypothetical protein